MAAPSPPGVPPPRPLWQPPRPWRATLARSLTHRASPDARLLLLCAVGAERGGGRRRWEAGRRSDPAAGPSPQPPEQGSLLRLLLLGLLLPPRLLHESHGAGAGGELSEQAGRGRSKGDGGRGERERERESWGGRREKRREARAVEIGGGSARPARHPGEGAREAGFLLLSFSFFCKRWENGVRLKSKGKKRMRSARAKKIK